MAGAYGIYFWESILVGALGMVVCGHHRERFTFAGIPLLCGWSFSMDKELTDRAEAIQERILQLRDSL